ncbi:EAL domain-containing protein [Pseudothauera rhizosphaerae]|uniref:EAL domain-containing protein n=1 Tax=Pseudothauera rhizosphaerae TaxID=2565932 RepID=A0A4S4AS03_9RHOO|nr:EAL domain-containing protein [Pseudothauera rhizosphaerae]THF62575.1 EAL domain-containing protein [Pseudothauera rhizosphaerae]
MTDAERTGDIDAVHAQMERVLGLYAMLSRINRSIVRVDNPHDLYVTACRIAVEDGGFAASWVDVLDPGSGHVLAVARAGVAIDLSAPPGGGTGANVPSMMAIGDKRACVINDVAGDGRLAPWRAVFEAAAVHAVAAFPLMQEGRTIGAFVIAAAEAGAFDTGRLVLLTEVAGDVSFALEVMRREEKRAVAESKIQYLAYYDAQTGLPGRELWIQRLAGRCAAGPVAVLVVNLRSYHGVLQVLGQAHGPELARAVAARLEDMLPTALVGRVTEAEFALVLEGADGVHVVEETARKVGGALADAIHVDGREVFLDPFIGIALFPQDGEEAQAVLKAALIAAGTAQDSGDHYRIYAPELDTRWQHRLALEGELRHALERGQLQLHYQPQVDLESGRVVGAEALLRWFRPGHGLVPPLEFIPLLEETGMIVQVGAWVLEEACRNARHWQDAGLPPLRVAVNLSARQFQDGDIGALVGRVLTETGLEARWLELEITESIVMRNAEAVTRTLDRLRGQGVSHSLDDFGTGYSSLSYLQRLPVSRIKIDRSFITHITSDPHDAAIVQAVVGMAHSLGISVIAEGVETEGQLGYLRGLRCEEIQGYYFSRPLPAHDFVALLYEDRRLAPPAVDSGRVLLLVDDEPSVLAALRRLLRPTEIEVQTCARLDDAFEVLATGRVGVVVCDQRMPGMTGTEFLRRVRKLHPNVIRIVLSGYTELSSVIDAVNRGAIYKFLTKPWDDQVLLESLRDAFRMYELNRENRELSHRVSELLASGRAVR